MKKDPSIAFLLRGVRIPGQAAQPRPSHRQGAVFAEAQELTRVPKFFFRARPEALRSASVMVSSRAATGNSSAWKLGRAGGGAPSASSSVGWHSSSVGRAVGRLILYCAAHLETIDADQIPSQFGLRELVLLRCVPSTAWGERHGTA